MVFPVSSTFDIALAINTLLIYNLVVFTSTGASENIKVWDVRFRSLIYELAMGNNEAGSLAWDANKNSLYVATVRNHVEYCRARIHKAPESGMNGGDGEVGEDDIEEEDDDICWPKEASQCKSHFGHVFDAGNHRLGELILWADELI